MLKNRNILGDVKVVRDTAKRITRRCSGIEVYHEERNL